MAETFEQKIKDAGHKVAREGRRGGPEGPATKTGKAAEWVKDKAHQAGDKIERGRRRLRRRRSTTRRK